MRTTKNKQAISLLAAVATVLYAAPVFAGAVINLTVTDMSGAPVFVDQVNGVSRETQSSATATTTTGQEAAVRFGMLGSLTDVTADDYPGVGSRDIDLDGHFVDVRVTFIPEPAAMSLISLAGLLLFRKRPVDYR